MHEPPSKPFAPIIQRTAQGQWQAVGYEPAAYPIIAMFSKPAAWAQAQVAEDAEVKLPSGQKRSVSGQAMAGKLQGSVPDKIRFGQSGGSTGWIDEADEAYDIIRNRTDDIQLISQNTGFKASNIEKIKNHLFYDTHKKYDAYGDDMIEWGRLDSDAKIAESWNRLIEGAHGLDDIKLLKHEAAERKILEIWGPGSGKAHQRAHDRYPSPIQD